MDRFRRLQHLMLLIWCAALLLCLWAVGHMFFVQAAGRTLTGTVVATSIWNPPIFTWSRYVCTVQTPRGQLTLESGVTPCQDGQQVTLKQNPLDHQDVWYDGEYLSGRTAMPWYFLAISLLIIAAGLALRATRHASPWRTAISWVLDLLQR